MSRATVSNAYNRPDQLSADLRATVLRAAKRLGYPGPNPTARSLATNRVGAIAFMLDGGLSVAFSDPALSITLDALAAAIDPTGHALLLLPGGESGGPRADRVLAAQADLAVAYSLADGAPALRAVRDRRLPLVVIDQPVLAGCPRVGIDDRGGAAAAAAHLLELGHRRFAVLAPTRFPAPYRPLDRALTVEEAMASRYRVGRERLSGYLDTIAAAGIDPASVPIWEAADFARAEAVTAATALLRATPRPTALLCQSDELALAALTAARNLGLAVPGDLSVVGFDDTPPAQWAEPALTTVRQDLAGKGRVAGELAVALLAGRRPSTPVITEVSLVVRHSTGPPR